MALTVEEASIILGMLSRGDDNQDISAWFGVNPARIVEVAKGKFPSATAAPAHELPPKGAVGPKGRRLYDQVGIAINSLEQGKENVSADVASFLRNALADFSQDET